MSEQDVWKEKEQELEKMEELLLRRLSVEANAKDVLRWHYSEVEKLKAENARFREKIEESFVFISREYGVDHLLAKSLKQALSHESKDGGK